MDPNTTLAEILRLARAIERRADTDGDGWRSRGDQRTGEQASDGEELAELVLALDGWMARGGFKPVRWGGL